MLMKKARQREMSSSGAHVMEYIAGTQGNPLAGAALGLYQDVDRRWMPPMTWHGVYNMNVFCVIVIDEEG